MLDRLVVIADKYMREIDCLPWLEGDFTIGEVNSFELKVPKDMGIKRDYYIMVDESEYGGVIDDIDSDSLEEYITVSGRTWHGILYDTPVKPDAGHVHVVVSGDANEIMQSLLEKKGLTDRIVASSDASGFKLNNYVMLSKTGNRFFDLYTGFRRMLNSVNAKLNITYDSSLRKAVCSAVERANHIDDGLDGDIVPIRIKTTRPYNHALCIGAGEGLERLTCDVYADDRGNVSTNQSIFGIGYRGKIYENVNCDNIDDLRNYGLEHLADLQSDLESCSLSGDLVEDYDIDDIVGAQDIDQEQEVITFIAQKIATFDKNANLSFETKTDLEVNR